MADNAVQRLSRKPLVFSPPTAQTELQSCRRLQSAAQEQDAGCPMAGSMPAGHGVWIGVTETEAPTHEDWTQFKYPINVGCGRLLAFQSPHRGRQISPTPQPRLFSLRCSSLKYSRYSHSSRLAQAGRVLTRALGATPGFHHGLLRARQEISVPSGCRGARLARREECAYREYVSDEQRRQTGCIGGQDSAVIS